MTIEMLWSVAGGDATAYESLKRKDIFEFFMILGAHDKRVKQLKPKDNG